MKRQHVFIILFHIITCLIIMQTAYSDNEPSAKTISNIIIDTEKTEIRINCRLALENGILEWLLVDEKGQTYESVFKVMENKPSELHFALLLLGFDPLSYNEYQLLLKDKDAVRKLVAKNCVLKIEIKQKDKTISFDKIIKNRESNDEEPLYWIFTGSFFTAKNLYAADLSLIYISIWPEKTAVISLFSNAGNPYRGDLGFEMADESGFSVDDDFTLIIKGAN